MASAQELIALGNTLLSSKHYIAAMNALWFYDYFLTLADEVEWAWSRRSFVSVLFALNRYWPLWYLPWLYAAFWCPGYTKSMCEKTAFLSAFYFIFASVFAQATITLRIYAVTGNNRRVASYLSLMILAQFIFGIYLIIFVALRPAAKLPDLPFDEYQICLFQRWRTGEVIYIMFSLAYDISAFTLVAWSSRNRGGLARAPGLLGSIVQGATMYFLVIFTGHLLVIFFELLAPEPIRLLPASGNCVLIPLMSTRLLLSLKKAANAPDSTFGTTSGPQPESIRFASHPSGGTERSDDISL